MTGRRPAGLARASTRSGPDCSVVGMTAEAVAFPDAVILTKVRIQSHERVVRYPGY